MSQTTENNYASLFVDLTGRDTITERRTDGPDRRLQNDDDRDVTTYVADNAREHGLDDAIEAPDTE
ncbi:hypothetical protein [Halobacterium bonnevillei]|uniref:Uncharacterized protein n=1 Tax=Halobacterium bonnevillei TaxID=2692200 RepID=A0A6B0SIB9_9EURY|nr:hypothetical protein [Halobacterium bonnevillei]MXR19601.1 hypothetical protein [Halobacterium bonnevillei]